MIRLATSTCYTNYGSTASRRLSLQAFSRITSNSSCFTNSAPIAVLTAVQLLWLRAPCGRVGLVLQEGAQVTGADDLQDVNFNLQILLSDLDGVLTWPVDFGSGVDLQRSVFAGLAWIWRGPHHT